MDSNNKLSFIKVKNFDAMLSQEITWLLKSLKPKGFLLLELLVFNQML